MILLSSITFAQSTKHITPNKQQNDSLKKEIETMCESDQKYRWMMMLGELDEQKIMDFRNGDQNLMNLRITDVMKNKTGLSQWQKDSIGHLQDKIDSLNFLTLSGIINRYGFPQCVKAWKVSTILLHASPTLMNDDFFKMLMEEVKNGNLPGYEYAAMYDKMRTAKKLPELYYVNEHFDQATKTSHILTPIDINATNIARKEIGLKKIK
ncbi:MAG: hypothetical protein H7257_08155 [Taibaiella sp.]|nr:hypothetical protein [Taibaiella sp.]